MTDVVRNVPEVWFPAATDGGGDLLARTAIFWNLDGPLPYPRFVFDCPICGGAMRLRYWKFHAYRLNANKKYPYRCDVAFKCIECAFCPTFGIAVPQEMYEPFALHNEITSADYLRGEILPDEPERNAALAAWRKEFYGA